MNKKNIISTSEESLARKLKILDKKRKGIRREFTKEESKLSPESKKLAEIAAEKEEVRKKLAITAAELAATARELAATATEKEDVRKKLAITAKELATTAEELAMTATEKEVVRKKLAITASELAVTATEKEEVRSRLAITAEGKEVVRKKLATTAEELAKIAVEKEEIRVKLVITAKELAVTATENEDIRKKLAITAEKLATTAVEKEDVRRELEIAANKLAMYTKGLETKVVVGTGGFAETNAKNEAILASIADGLVVVDEKGSIIYINKSFEKMLGWKTQEVIGRSMDKVVTTEDIGGIEVPFKEKILSQVLAGERFIIDLTNPFYFIRKDKTRFPVSIVVTPVFIAGKIVGAVETFRDITKDKERTESIADRVKELERLNKVMVGRELKMVELKKELAELKKLKPNL